jgi:hypothetical protein
MDRIGQNDAFDIERDRQKQEQNQKQNSCSGRELYAVLKTKSKPKKNPESV